MTPEQPVFFFSGWAAVGRTLLVGVLSYLSLLVMLRLSGKRTLAKMNVFDFIMTVAIGSTLATVLTSSSVSFLDALAAFFVLVGLQFLFAFIASRSHRLERLINGRPTLLLHRGRFLEDAMQRARVTEEEVRAAVRVAGAPRLEEVDAVVLETDGVFSVLRGVGEGAASTLADVRGFERVDPRRHAEARERGLSADEQRADGSQPPR